MSTLSSAEAVAIIDSLAGLQGRALIEALVLGPLAGRVAVTASFGAESAVLLDLVAQVDPGLPVIFLDTGALFDETIAYRQSLARHLGLTGVVDVAPTAEESQAAEELWTTDSDRCCALRKVAPLARAVEGFAALIDGRRRSHGFARESLPAVSFVQGRIKASPLSDLDDAAIEAVFAARRLPPHPLVADGYRSIGCWPCTRPVAPGEPARAGRWAGAAKTECGIHLPLPADPPAPPKGLDSAS